MVRALTPAAWCLARAFVGSSPIDARSRGPTHRRTVAAFAELARHGSETGSTVYKAMKRIA